MNALQTLERTRTSLWYALVLGLGLSADLAQAESPSVPSRQWAVIIAVKNYESPLIQDLNVTLNDAADFKKTVITQGGLDRDNILELTDDSTVENRPTKSNLKLRLTEFLSRPEAGDTLLFFYSGHGIERDGSAYLLPIDADPNEPTTWLKARTIAEYVSACRAKAKFLILDACHAGGDKGVRPDARARSPRSSNNNAKSGDVLAREICRKDYVGLLSCKGEEKSYEWGEKQESFFTYWLCRGLEGAADSNGDGRVSCDEIYGFTLDRVRRTVTNLKQDPQTPSREIDATVTGDPIVLTLVPESQQEVSQRLAGHLDQEIRLRGFGSVTVSAEFRVKSAGRGQLASFALPKYLAEQIRDELQRLGARDHRYGVVDEPAGADAGVRSTAAPRSTCGPESARPEATVFGELSFVQGRGIGVQCDLFAGDGSLLRPSGLIALDENRIADLGRSFSLAAAPSRLNPAERTVYTLRQAKEMHPLLDKGYPYRIEVYRFLELDPKANTPIYSETPEPLVQMPKPPWDGTSVDPDPRKLAIAADDGEVFKVRLHNDSDERVLVTLLIDGINTFGKKPELLGEGGGWIIEPRSYGDVQGWMAPRAATAGNSSSVDADASWFEFTDVSKSVARRLNATDKIGLITAAYYAEAGAGDRALGVGEIKGGTTRLELKPFKRGRMLGTVQLGYLDARELRDTVDSPPAPARGAVPIPASIPASAP